MRILRVLPLALLAFGCNERGGQSENLLKSSELDSSIRLESDFYNFTNNRWLSATEIPATESSWSNFHVLDETNRERIRSILDSALAVDNPEKGSAIEKLGMYYRVAMDSAGVEKAGAQPLMPLMEEVQAEPTKEALFAHVAKLHGRGLHVLLHPYVDQDARNSKVYALQFWQGGLSLPSRDYYFNQDPQSQKIREALKTHFTKLGEGIGMSARDATATAEKVLAFETRLAKSSMAPVEMRDPNRLYNKYTLGELPQAVPGWDWKTWFENSGTAKVDYVIVNQPEFIRNAAAAWKEADLDLLKKYVQIRIAGMLATKLSNDFVMSDFDLYEKALSGTPEIQPRWKRSGNATEGAMGELLGQIYVEKYFSPRAKERAEEMVENIRLAYRERLTTLDWMSDTTQKKAIEKLDRIMVKIGYPDKWKDYSALEVEEDNYLNNTIRANEFAWNRMIDKLGKPVDRTEWGMTPQTVNAYYNPSLNEIVFPAAILQFPFFDENADDALNYGAIGAVIGHEITHGFDDQGRQFDADGNLKSWWTKGDSARFVSKAQMLVEQYNAYVPVDTFHINGSLTLGENIADLGGLTLAYYGLQRKLKDSPQETIDGMTAEQRFFYSWSRGWRYKARDEYLKQQVLVDPHSNARFRVLGPLSNMDEFHQAFKLSEESPMRRADSLRIAIW